MSVLVAPSILSADFARLGDEVRAVTDAGADLIHVDVMDGHFVPNLTIGPAVVAALKPHTRLPLDVHLMITPPEPLLDRFIDAGAAIVTIHAEATTHLERALKAIKARGVKAGVSIVPSTSERALDYVMDVVDLVLVMTVNPGFGGQVFLEPQLEKIARVRRMIEAAKRPIYLEVDGGITPETARRAVAAGADVLVAGSAVFAGTADRYSANIQALRG